MVPLVMAGAGIPADDQTSYDEIAAAAAGRRFDKGWELMDAFVKKSSC
jgi:2,3-bisphosphoglycerate-independent phosphoglycerate mutase